MTHSKYKATIGMEIHTELKTRTKMFCDSKNDPDEKRPNVNICPVCMAHPGALPVINKEAVKSVLKVGVAIGGKSADFTEFDRKNYFYPDIPKGYQISQYKYPLVSGGELAGVAITRVHLEEDTATSKHYKGDYSLVDYNRAGVPLMELVTEPVIHDSDTAVLFAKELQLLLRYLGVSDANMEKGEMRIEANISVSDTDKFGIKVEVKNLNSFKVVGKAIAYEIERQIKALEAGEDIIQETRGWDEDKNATFSQRRKESSDDYRYFPDPDLPKLKISEIAEFQDIELPELPQSVRARFINEFGLSNESAEILVQDTDLQSFFNEVVEDDSSDKNFIKLSSNYILSDMVNLFKIFPEADWRKNILPKHFAELMKMTLVGEISSRGAKDILAILFENGGEPKTIAKEKKLLQKNDEDTLTAVVGEVIAEQGEVVSDYRNGNEKALQFLIGQGMRKTKGSGNPVVLKKLFEKMLKQE